MRKVGIDSLQVSVKGSGDEGEEAIKGKGDSEKGDIDEKGCAVAGCAIASEATVVTLGRGLAIIQVAGNDAGEDCRAGEEVGIGDHEVGAEVLQAVELRDCGDGEGHERTVAKAQH